MKPIRTIIALWVLTIAGITTANGQDPLPSWNDGSAKQAIVEFVRATTGSRCESRRRAECPKVRVSNKLNRHVRQERQVRQQSQ